MIYIVIKSKMWTEHVDKVQRIIKVIRIQQKFDEITVLLHMYP